ncbi:MAG TPA: uracil-DNA glycosylase [Microthrixaceae bacterium]|nr:uracil-DNA glycosylase [Microthrixaceae bacterium]HMY88164.1 uracil-DNA glycosylase [Microthrixaceae bacterium]HNA36187.1 uracil-DNA glycosylase [Microthrixaceae bacterium]HNE75169.1 uracil-DNA glycosylase [Microthrixaceae bacterium]HNG22510.1 uracil-DNA glycosylase [Microthrixaceae bacterium]
MAPVADDSPVPADRAERAAAFAELRDRALECRRCRLAEGRTQVVFGSGDPDADLMFVGEGPGAEEDRQGLPFVGRSGQLLDRLMAEEMDLTRDRAYIANVVKCRPPDNRDPKLDEIEACRPWLEAQVDLIGPKVIVTLGNFSSRLLLDTREGITRLRGSVYPYRDRPDGTPVQLVPTFHPAAVLRGGGEPMAGMRADLVRAKQTLGTAASAGTGASVDAGGSA